MKFLKYILFFFLCITFILKASTQTQPDFQWGNASYFNLNTGESIIFNDVEIKLLKLENHYNKIQIGPEVIWMKVSKRSLPQMIKGLQIFVADNKNVKALSADTEVHGLLKKDALICISADLNPLLNPNEYIFPISFNDGFQWNAEDNCPMFTNQEFDDRELKDIYHSHEGIDINLHDARGIEKHWIVAIENSTVVWVKDKGIDEAGKEACVLLKSDSQPGIYYVYNHLYNKNVEVQKGQKLVRGQLIGTIWGDNIWGYLHLSVINSDTIPTFENRQLNSVNFFPQLYELYFKQLYSFPNSFTKGSISFGKLYSLKGNRKNTDSYEGYSGKGWIFGSWNKADKISCVSKGKEGNVRLNKELFSGTKAASINPDNWYNYEINVRNGVYRIRAKVGDLFASTWQQISFEGVSAGTYSLESGVFKWTPEKVVKVTDGKLTVLIFVDEKNNTTAGLSEIVFQQAY